MRPSIAIYVDWHMPRKRRGRMSLCKKPWEIAMIVRTTYFAEHYNRLKPVLYCDIETLRYYQKIGLDRCFNEIYPILPQDPDFDPSIFWSAGKFMAIEHTEENFLMIDLDAEVRFELDFDDCDIFCSHLENIHNDDIIYYPPPEYLDPENFLGKMYDFKWESKAYNTSLLYFNDLLVAKEYAKSSLDYIRGLKNINPAFELGYILLAEQRFLYELAKSKNIKVNTLISGIYNPKNDKLKTEAIFENSNVNEIGKRGFLHVWGGKNKMMTEDVSLYTSLLLSRSVLTKQIEYCVAMNRNILNGKK